MATNVVEDLKQALQELSNALDDSKVKNAIACIPKTVRDPIIEGLRTILNVIKDTLDELKNSLNCVADLDELLNAMDKLLIAVEGLAPDQKETIERVKAVVKTLQDLPDAKDIEAIIGLIEQIIGKLEVI